MENVPAVTHAISGAIGGSAANLLLYPLDVVTVRLQVKRDTDNTLSPQDDSDLSLDSMFRQILREEGWSALFEGIGDDLVATASQSFLYFFVYDYLRNRRLRYHMKKRGRVPRTLGIRTELLFGAVAGMVCKLFTTPIKNVVVQKQIDHTRRKTVRQVVHEICEHKGMLGLWSGYRATIFLSANPSLSYYFYQLFSKANNKHESTGRVFFKAALAKSLATVFTYPVILAKTRAQAKQGPSNIYRTIWRTYKTLGLVGLYDGVMGQLLKGCISQGITMTTKESISRFVVYVYILVAKHRLRTRI